MSDDFLTVPPQYDGALNAAAVTITQGYLSWERGEDVSPSDDDNIRACVEALDASGVPWPGYTEEGLRFLGDELFERHSQGDWTESRQIARWVIARLVQDAAFCPDCKGRGTLTGIGTCERCDGGGLERKPLADYLDIWVVARDGRKGEVIAVDPSGDAKPLIVRHGDGSIGYYYPDQVEPA